MKIARVFPRQTNASPDDEFAFFGVPNRPDIDVDEVHVSVTFTADKPIAEELAEAWRHVAPVKIGGRAYGDPGGDFVPGMYLKHGYLKLIQKQWRGRAGMVEWIDIGSDMYRTKQVGNKKQMMPDGYWLVWIGNGYIWWHEKTDTEGLFCWDKWRVRRCAIAHSKKMEGGG